MQIDCNQFLFRFFEKAHVNQILSRFYYLENEIKIKLKKYQIKRQERAYRVCCKEDVTIVTVEGSFNFKKVTKAKENRGFHTLKPVTLGNFNLRGKVYFHYVSPNITVPHKFKKALIDTYSKPDVTLVTQPTLLLNEGIPRALKGEKLRLKNILLLPLIFEEMNSF